MPHPSAWHSTGRPPSAFAACPGRTGRPRCPAMCPRPTCSRRTAMPGLYAEHLELLDPARLPIPLPSTISRDTALAAMKAAPSNAEVLAACKAAYQQHTNAVDSVTTGSISAAQAPELSGDIAAAHSYDWNSKVAAPSLTSPILTSTHMAGARGAVTADGDFATFFVGIEANIAVFVGGVGGIGAGGGFP